MAKLPGEKGRGDPLFADDINMIVEAVKVALATKGGHRFNTQIGPGGIIITESPFMDSGIPAEWAWAKNTGEEDLEPFRPAGITGQVFDEENDGNDKRISQFILKVINPTESKINFEGNYVICAELITPGQIGRVWHSGLCPAWGLSTEEQVSGTGAMTTYTNGTEVAVALESGHGIEDEDVVDVTWAEDGDPKARSGVVVSLAEPVATLTGGSGDLYPDDVGLSMDMETSEIVVKTYAELLAEVDEDDEPDYGKDYLTCSTGGSTRVIWKKENSDDEQLVMVRLGFASILVSPQAIVPVKLTSKVNYNTYLGVEYNNGTDVGPSPSDTITIRVLQIGSAETIPTGGDSTFFPSWLQKWGGVLYRTIDVARDY